jgi:hypothetical protein
MNYVEDTHNAMESIDTQARKLDSIASAFYTTGNYAMGDKLAMIADTIREDSQLLQDAISKDIRDQAQRSMDASANMLGAALVMSEINRENKS